MLGARGQSAIATLVERQTRYVMLLAVGRNKTSHHVCALIAKKIRTLPQHLAVSLTWDRGKEMARHRQFSIATGVHVYFCDPSSPWQRGSNENTNGLLRQYFPRGSDLSVHSQRHLNRVAHVLNDRPRQTLGWMKPSEKLAKLLRGPCEIARGRPRGGVSFRSVSSPPWRTISSISAVGAPICFLISRPSSVLDGSRPDPFALPTHRIPNPVGLLWSQGAVV